MFIDYVKVELTAGRGGRGGQTGSNNGGDGGHGQIVLLEFA